MYKALLEYIMLSIVGLKVSVVNSTKSSWNTSQRSLLTASPYSVYLYST